MVTPHVVGDHLEADKLTKEFQNRVSQLREKIDKMEKLKKNKAAGGI